MNILGYRFKVVWFVDDDPEGVGLFPKYSEHRVCVGATGRTLMEAKEKMERLIRNGRALTPESWLEDDGPLD